MQQSCPVAQRAFFIVEPNPIISMDLVGVIRSGFPESIVNVAQIVSDAITQISGLAPKEKSVLLSGRLVSNQSIRMVSDAIGPEGRLVVVGETPVSGINGPIVPLPFTTRMILTALS